MVVRSGNWETQLEVEGRGCMCCKEPNDFLWNLGKRSRCMHLTWDLDSGLGLLWIEAAAVSEMASAFVGIGSRYKYLGYN